jgi:endonuclease/exonuclease/phosphatase family metal-dependent hydrolase
MMKFTFGSWNLNNRSLQNGHLELLRSVDCDLLALQEATERFHSELSKLNLFDWSVSSLMLRPPGVDEGRTRRHGCSVFGRWPFRPDSCRLLTALHFPERALVANALCESTPLTVCSFHIPPGATWGMVKPETMKAIAEWLGSQHGSVVVGMDANSPKTDHPDQLKSEWWWKDEPALLGPTPLHRLRDAFRVFLGDRQDLFDAIKTSRPAGPLAISYLRGSKVKNIPCRYDVILVSPEVAVSSVEYHRLNDALSDHALVVSHLELCVQASAVRPPEHQARPPRPIDFEAAMPQAIEILQKRKPRSTQISTQRARKRPRLNFDEMGIPSDSVLKSVASHATVRVAGPHMVCLGAVEMTLTEATRKVLGPNFNGTPCPQWTFNGRSLGKIYDATYGAALKRN